MDLVKRSSGTSTKSWLARTFAKVFHIQAVKSHKKMKKGQTKLSGNPSLGDKEDKTVKDNVIDEAFLAKTFASISTVKAAYAQMQLSQSPYDADGIQSSDQTIVSELKILSELKQCYLKKQLNESSPEEALVLSEIQEHKSLIKTYEITGKKLDFQLKLKESEITFLDEKLAEVNRDNKALEKNLSFSGLIAMPDSVRFSDIKPFHFITYYHQVVKSIRSFVRLLINAMESANWNLDLAASSIEPGISFWKPNHKCFAFESFVCKQMFDSFNNPNFSPKSESKTDGQKCFALFVEMVSAPTADYLARKPESLFASFCREKYSRLVHPKMESSIFGNLDQRDLVGGNISGAGLPETAFFSAFCEMSKRVWLLHCLAMSFEPEVTVFEVGKGAMFSEVYMESLSDEAFLLCDANSGTYPRVAFTVVPGFRVGKTVVQTQVYLY